MILTLQVDFDEMSVSNRFVVKPNVDAELDESKSILCTVSCQKYSRKMAEVEIELSRFGYFELRKR